MGREVRRVPKGWQHPKDARGRYIPLHSKTYKEKLAETEQEEREYEAGTHWILKDRVEEFKKEYPTYKDWNGDSVYSPEDYMPDDNPDRSCYQMYETVTEGTPVSPVFETKEELTDWLVSQGRSRAAAEAFVEDGWAPSMVIVGGQMATGVDAAALLKKK